MDFGRQPAGSTSYTVTQVYLGSKNNWGLTSVPQKKKSSQKILKYNIISDMDRVHLLGCNVPQEYLYYKDFPFYLGIIFRLNVFHLLNLLRTKSVLRLLISKQVFL